MLIIVVALMAVFVPAEPLPVDRAWSDAMQDIQSEALRNVALAFNWLGRGLGIALTVSAVAVALIRRHRWLALVSFGVVESLAPLSSSLLKALVGRARPPDGAIYPHSSSFPSGHTTYAGATCVALVLLFTRLESRRLWWSLASLGTIGMAWSRTYLQVHWLSDVIAGALLGVGIALLVFGGAQRGRPPSPNHRTGRHAPGVSMKSGDPKRETSAGRAETTSSTARLTRAG